MCHVNHTEAPDVRCNVLAGSWDRATSLRSGVVLVFSTYRRSSPLDLHATVRSIRLRIACSLLLLATTLQGSLLFAGGGPENVLVVANPLSIDSLTIANHYCSLRQIHGVNVVYLPWTGSRETIDVETFRRSILQPIFREIERRRLRHQIDYIVYSSGFPYAVDFSADVRTPLRKESGAPIGSLTSLTFQYARIQSRKTSYAFSADNSKSNFYVGSLTRGFRHRFGWTRFGQQTLDRGEHYYLSVMLGYTDGRGNSVEEVIDYLQRSALADCTHPSGTVYLMQIANEIRTKTRDGAFPVVQTALNQLGVAAEIESGVTPRGKTDVIGAVLGRSVVKWEQSQSKFQPGAICDNLTSFGGMLRKNASQTPLTDFLRYGAAGASGTVVEPFALQAKFPHPWLQVHYARGASLAEAFYQSVASPYQLLIIGDPLCQPWANAPHVGVNELQPGQIVSGQITLTPHSTHASGVQEYQLFLDGRYLDSCRPAGQFRLDSRALPDGHHEIRIVAIEESPVASQGRLIYPVHIDNQGNSVEWTIRSDTITAEQPAELLVTSRGAKSIYLYHGRRPLGRINQDRGRFTVDAHAVGEGPVTLTAVAINDSNHRKVFSTPIHLSVREQASF